MDSAEVKLRERNSIEPIEPVAIPTTSTIPLHDFTDTETVTVKRVIDADTIEVDLSGNTVDVRLLLLDAPETVSPYEPVEAYGPMASAFAKEVLLGKKVQLEYDGPMYDQYGRILAYVWVDGKLFNQQLLEEGLAHIAYIYDPPYKYYDICLLAQTRAKNAKKGIWA